MKNFLKMYQEFWNFYQTQSSKFLSQSDFFLKKLNLSSKIHLRSSQCLSIKPFKSSIDLPKYSISFTFQQSSQIISTSFPPSTLVTKTSQTHVANQVKLTSSRMIIYSLIVNISFSSRYVFLNSHFVKHDAESKMQIGIDRKYFFPLHSGTKGEDG